MIWNYAYNKPWGSYQVSECDTQKFKEEVVSILRDRYFEGMCDDFFIGENLEQAKLAWNTGVAEIRQEFVRDENAINILKKI